MAEGPAKVVGWRGEELVEGEVGGRDVILGLVEGEVGGEALY